MRKALRKVLKVAGFMILFGLADYAVTPSVQASYGLKDALGTIGISTGIGTVLGLSTIAFYDTPTRHLANAAIGAGAGMFVGIGVAAYLMANSSDEDEINPEELLPPENRPRVPSKKLDQESEKKLKGKQSRHWDGQLPDHSIASVPGNFAARPAQWAIAMQVLELRF